MNKATKKRSCDVCRRKKIRCDGPEMPDRFCSNCKSYNLDCTYEESARKRGPPKGYVESLEARLTKAETLLKELVPDGDFSRELGIDVDRETWAVHRMDEMGPSVMVHPTSAAPKETELEASILSRAFRAHASDVAPAKDEQFEFMGPSLSQLSDNMANLETALNMKNEYTGQETNTLEAQDLRVTPSFRQRFWSNNEWETPSDPLNTHPLQYTLPEPDLLNSLIALYFRHTNVYFPLLHRPTFERLIQENKHQTDTKFALTVLLVAAIGSRHSDDPRIFLGSDQSHSAGWKWFNQVSIVRRAMLEPPSLHDLQFHALCVLFLIASSAPQACWTMTGIGIRLAQDIGAHRKRKNTQGPSAEEEQWKRVFWVLVALDRLTSSGLGRPCAIQEEDFDLDYLQECDDEWWDHPDPEKAWKQPPGQPAQVTAFNAFLRLTRILAQCHRTIYSINKHQVALRLISQDWEQVVVTEVDSLLNQWVDSIPPHLLWDPHREDGVLFGQSGWLHATFYNLQILVHRPFISSSKATKHMMWSSFAICTNAARMTAKILDSLMHRERQPGPLLQMNAFTSGIVLLLAIWGGKKAGLSTSPKMEMKSVAMCMDYLKSQENRWHSAGRLWDILNELATVGDIPIPEPSEFPSRKRDRNDKLISPISDSSPESPGTPIGTEQRRYAGTRRVAVHAMGVTHSTTSSPSTGSASTPPSMDNMPMYTTELGHFSSDPSADFFSKTRDYLFPTGFARLMNPSESQAPGPIPQQAGPSALNPSFFTGGLPSQGDPSLSSFFPPPPLSVPSQPLPSGSGSMQQQHFTGAPTPVQLHDAWANCPPGFDKLDDWAPYLSAFSQEGTQGSQYMDTGLSQRPEDMAWH